MPHEMVAGIDQRQDESIDAPLRVCIVVLDFAPTIGGAEARAEKQARRLRELGHHAEIFTIRRRREWPRFEALDGLPVTRIGGVFRDNGDLRVGRLGIWPVVLGLGWRLWRERNHYDVIHVIDYSSLAVAAAFVGKFARKPVVIGLQNTGPNSEQLAVLESQRRLMTDGLMDTSGFQLDDAYVDEMGHDTAGVRALGSGVILKALRRMDVTYQSLSTRSRDQLLAGGLTPGQIVLISGSVDTRRFRPAPGGRPEPSSSERLILCAARLEYGKGPDVLLHAWSRLLRAEAPPGLRPHLWLVGQGRLRSQLEAMAQALSITESVEFLGARTDVLNLLQHAWGFVLPSRWEGMPNALLEAMACGLPCVATRVSGSEDIITDGVDGLLVEPERPDELAEALRRIMYDAEFAQQLGQRARERVATHFSLEHVVDECVALYRRLLAQGGHAARISAESTGGETSPSA